MSVVDQPSRMRVAVLSPHRDDAAFSCGLTLRAMVTSGICLTIVNVCTVSRYAPYLVDGIGDLTQQVTQFREREDANFIELLNRDVASDCGAVELIDLAWEDVPIRWRIADAQAIASMELRTEEVEELANVFCGLARFDLVFAPMALGGHLDHRLVLESSKQAFPPASLVFYEDLPYACRMSAAERASSWLETDMSLPEAWLPERGATGKLKRECALCYPSQIAAEVAEEMESYAMMHGGRERYLAHADAMLTLKTALKEDGAFIG